MPLPPLIPQEPSPVEIQSWSAGHATNRQQYNAQQAQNTYGQTQATNAYDLQRNQLAYNQQQGRQTFDDPYIGRGIFNSGIRGQGLQNFYTQGANAQANAQQQYLAQYGQYGLNNDIAGQQFDTAERNLYSAEDARRTQLRAMLAQDIKGVQ